MKILFYPGDKWLYMKLYMGPETAESWLTGILPALISELKEKRMTGNFFFLRYLDPCFHVRLRFELNNPEYLGTLVRLCREHSKDYFENELIWKAEIGTYEREVERYGEDWIRNAEKIFSCDSEFWLAILPSLRESEDNEQKRWLAALLSAHSLLDDFGLSYQARTVLLENMVYTLSKEMQGGKNLRLQIDKKFRENRRLLENVMSCQENLDLEDFHGAIKNRSLQIEAIPDFQEIIGGWDEMTAQSRISDIIHLSLNRGLRSKHRMQELVIYSFLLQLYVSDRAKN